MLTLFIIFIILGLIAGNSSGSGSKNSDYKPKKDLSKDNQIKAKQLDKKINSPTIKHQQPATSNQQPATSNQQPATSNQQPATSNVGDVDSHYQALEAETSLSNVEKFLEELKYDFNLSENDELDKLTKEQLLIKEEIANRNIEFLIHFTRRENLDGILKYGLAGRKYLFENHIPYYYNDEHRIDNIENGVCCSISFPNYKMFYGIRKNQEKHFGTSDNNWVIIRINPEILWRKSAYFCRYNAASNAERFNFEKMDFQSFQAMFGNLQSINREILNIPNNFTTNPQAEVVFVDIIEPEWIIDICVKNGYGMNCYKISDLHNQYYYEKDSLFKPRQDYQFWTKQ